MTPDRLIHTAAVMIYTDDALLALGTATVLSSAGFDVIEATPEVSELVPQVANINPGFLLLDLTPDVTAGLLAALRQAAPETQLVIWGRTFGDELLAQAKELGVAGFLRRGISREKFVECFRSIAGGDAPIEKEVTNTTRVPLTPRESQLVALLQQGLRNKEIGACLGITEGTVRMYLSKLFAKTGARDRFEVALFGLKNSVCGHAAWDGRNAFVTDSDAGRARPVLRSLMLVEPARRRGYARLSMAVGE
jgi:two-component system nitrate/nitrite response regulator NarL